MELLFETGTAADRDVLAAAWDGARSFAFAPRTAQEGSGWLRDAVASVPAEWREGHFALLTSGSTGEPKLVVGTKRRTEGLADKIHAAQRLDGVRSAVLALPLSYSYSFVNQWLWSHRTGVELVYTRGLAEPGDFFDALTDAPAAMVCLVGSLLPILRRVLPAGRRFDGVVRVNFAGGAFPQGELPWLADVFPNAEVFNNYGCTEALPRIAVREARASADAACIGQPLPGIELSTGADGRLLFRSEHGAVGVVTQQGVHRFAPDEWIPTGDLGERGSDGAWYLRGRASEVFKRHGEKVSLPALLAAVKQAWDGSAAFYVETQAGEPGHVLVLAPGPSPDAVRRVLAALRRQFRRAQWPVRIESVPELPLLANGKPDAAAIARHPARGVLWRQF